MADNKIRRVVVAFEYRNGLYEGSPFTVFKPLGLVVWCDVPGAMIEVQEGAVIQGVAGFGRIPAQFFKQEGTTFEELKKQLIEKGKDIPARWLDWDLMTPGQTVKIMAVTPKCEAIGPDQIQLLFWGHTVKTPRPKPAHVMVRRADGTVEDPIVGVARSLVARSAYPSTLGLSLGPPRNLQRGDAGDDVKAWQMFCNSKTMRDELARSGKAVPSKLVEDGIFGHATEVYTMRVQHCVGTVADGIVGPETRRATLALVTRAADAALGPSSSAPSPRVLTPNVANIAVSPAKNAEPPEPVEAWSTPSWDDVS